MPLRLRNSRKRGGRLLLDSHSLPGAASGLCLVSLLPIAAAVSHLRGLLAYLRSRCTLLCDFGLMALLLLLTPL